MHAFASLSGVFISFSPLNIYISLFFCLSVLFLLPVCCRAPPCSLLHSPGAWPYAPLSPVFLACLPSACPPLLLLLPCVSSGGCRAVCPLSFLPFVPIWRALKLSGGLLCVVPCVFCCPSLVSHQAQNAMTVGADAARKCPRPDPLLPMCCRVFRCLFRGVRPSVRVCVLLPAVFWWQ